LAWTALQAQPLAFRRLDHRDGLPESQVRVLFEDRNGFLWLGAGDSLAMLGGAGFRVAGTAPRFTCRNIRAVLQDRRGSIWAAGTGLSEVRGTAVSNYGPEQGLVVEDLYSLVESRRGDLYVGSRLGLFHRQGTRFEQVNLPGNWSYTPIYCMVPDARNGLWLGSRQGLLGHWDGQTVNQVALPPGFETQAVNGLNLEADGGLRVLCSGGILRRDAAGAWRREALPGLRGNPTLRAFRVDPRGGLVVALGLDGLYTLSAAGAGRHLTYRDGLPRHSVDAALIDRNGVLWVGTDGGGLLALPEPQLKVLAYNPETGLDLGLGTILHFLEVGPGRMLLATFGGLVLWDQAKGIVQRWDSRQGLPSDEVWTLLADGGGGAWVGTTKGMARWSGGRILPGPAEIGDVSVNQFLLHQGRLWAGTTRGLAELEPSGKFISLSLPPQEVATRVITQMLPRPWGLLVGTSLGPYTFRAGQFKKAYPESPVAKESVATLGEDAQGQLWVGTQHGLFGLVGPASNRQWQAQEGTLENGVSWVRFLPSGAMAVGHTKGVTIVPAAGEPVRLTRSLGLLSNETNQDGALVDAGGRLWIGMVGGACILDTRLPLVQPALPAPVLLEAAWGADPVWLPTALTLPPNPLALSLNFDTPQPCAPNPPRYQVQVEGLDATWRAVDGQGTAVQIAQLRPGSYRFRVRASVDGLLWSESASCPVRVGRAWYQTWLAWTGFTLLGGLLLARVGKWRFKSLEKRARLLEKKIQERTGELALRNQALERLHHQLKQNMESRIHLMNTVTHDLRSPLTSILLSVDRLRSNAGEASDPVLNVLEREAARLEGLLKGMLDTSRAESLTDALDARLCRPSEILQGLTETFQLKAQSRELQTELDLDPGSGEVWVLADVTAMQQVLFNLVENALKFTAAPGPVGIRSRVLADTWMLEVWDRGRGIDPAMLEAIFQPFTQAQAADGRTGWGLGLSICRSIVQAHEGSIQVESAPGAGSLFRVQIPLVLPTKGVSG
jgi:signal transduction histidine kinase/streptogramin lyase